MLPLNVYKASFVCFFLLALDQSNVADTCTTQRSTVLPFVKLCLLQQFCNYSNCFSNPSVRFFPFVLFFFLPFASAALQLCYLLVDSTQWQLPLVCFVRRVRHPHPHFLKCCLKSIYLFRTNCWWSKVNATWRHARIESCFPSFSFSLSRLSGSTFTHQTRFAAVRARCAFE